MFPWCRRSDYLKQELHPLFSIIPWRDLYWSETFWLSWVWLSQLDRPQFSR